MHPDEKKQQDDIITTIENEIEAYRRQQDALALVRAAINERSFDVGPEFARSLHSMITNEQNTSRSLLLASIQQKAGFQ